jgi:ubiquinone/menaquinone biosynthesis C-methylase UbiE
MYRSAGGTNVMREWIDWYDSNHTIYANARHMDVHFRRIAEDIAQYVPSPIAAVLDYGCGEALHAEIVAARAGKLILAEPATGVRARLAAKYAGSRKISVCDTADLAGLPQNSIDLAVMHSVAQYLPPEEMDTALARLRRLIKPTGALLLGDIIAERTSAATDALALLRFGARDGFFIPAFIGLARTLFSNYWSLRSSLGLTRYDEAAMIAKLATNGFTATRQPRNIGHNQARMTFLARPA